MEIIIADKMESAVIEEIKKLGNTIVTPTDLKEAVANADVLIVRSATKVTKELLIAAKNLKLVARAGVGTDNIDKKECEKRGIKVVNTPGASSNAVAELALGLMLCFARKIPKADKGMKAKEWLKKQLTGTEIRDKTLGIVGLGRIGSLLAIKAKSVGMKIVYFDPHNTTSTLGKSVNMDELLASSDYISLHMPANEKTKGIIGSKAISKMKPTAVLVNTARGSLIDEQALYSALEERKIAGAALDVYPQEPYSGKLCELENIILTPHIAGSTKEAQMRIGIELIEKIRQEVS